MKFSISSTNVRQFKVNHSTVAVMRKNPIEFAIIVKPYALFFFFFFLFSCDSYEVVQIKVEIPAGVQVPEKMVYIPRGDFIMGHAEEPRTQLGKLVSSDAYFIDRYEVSHAKYKQVQPNHKFFSKSALYPVTHVSYSCLLYTSPSPRDS